jgi:hypothetical protein
VLWLARDFLSSTLPSVLHGNLPSTRRDLRLTDDFAPREITTIDTQPRRRKPFSLGIVSPSCGPSESNDTRA